MSGYFWRGLVIVSVWVCCFWGGHLGVLYAQEEDDAMEEAYRALKIFNYFKAREVFLQTKNQTPFLSAYGLALIYKRNDNPFSNSDSAYHYLEVARIHMLRQSKTQRKTTQSFLQKWMLKVDLKSLARALDTVSNRMYRSVLVEGTVSPSKINAFLLKYPAVPKKLKHGAERFRDSLAFSLAFDVGTVVSFREFMTHYPMSGQYPVAKKAYDSLLYRERTLDQSPESYRYFIAMYPKNPYADTAHYDLFRAMVPDQNPDQYQNYLKAFPYGRYAKKAWSELYTRYFTNYSDEAFDVFLRKYPDYPHPENVSKDRKLLQRTLYRIHRGGYYGFIDTSGAEVITPQYTFARDFHHGVALVSSGKYIGYINKKGAVKIPMRYDEGESVRDGCAVIDSALHLGLVNLRGEVVLPSTYERIEIQENGWYLTQHKTDARYRFYTSQGKLVAGPYTKAEHFSGGDAVVTVGDKSGLIDRGGAVVLEPNYDHLAILDPSDNRRYIAVQDKKYRIINRDGKTLSAASYDYIGSLSGGRILYAQAGKYGYFDKNLRVAIAPKFRIYSGYRKLAHFQKYAHTRNSKGKFGLIDSLGKRILPSIFDEIGTSDFPVPALRKKRWGFVDKRSKMMMHKYDALTPFQNGVSRAKRKSSFGLLKKIKLKKGFAIEVLLPVRYEKLEHLKAKLWVFRDKGLYGVLEAFGGRVVVKPEYTKIVLYPEDGDLLRLHLGDHLAYFRMSTGKYIYPRSDAQ